MRCLSCHYSLENLTEHRCPECGREFDPDDDTTFEWGRYEALNWPQLFLVDGLIFAIIALPFFIFLHAEFSVRLIVSCVIAGPLTTVFLLLGVPGFIEVFRWRWRRWRRSRN